MHILTILVIFSRVATATLLICARTKEEITYPLSDLFHSSEHLHSSVDALIHTEEVNETKAMCSVIFIFQQTPTEKLSFQFTTQIPREWESKFPQLVEAETIFIFDQWDQPMVQTRFRFGCRNPQILCNRLLFDYLIDSETYQHFLGIKYPDLTVHTYRNIVREHPKIVKNATLHCYHDSIKRPCLQQFCTGYSMIEMTGTAISRCGRFESVFPMLKYKLKFELVTTVLDPSLDHECNDEREASLLSVVFPLEKQ